MGRSGKDKKAPAPASAKPKPAKAQTPSKAAVKAAPPKKSKPSPAKSPPAKPSPAKKAAATKPPKSEKRAKSPKPKPTKVVHEKTSFTDYVIEAIQSLQTDDRKYIGLPSIQNYIFSYIEAANPSTITRSSKAAVEKLIVAKVLKRKRESVAFSSAAGDLAATAPPRREEIRTKPPKGIDTSPGGDLVQKTSSGRIAFKRY
jgi:hypothetical protein